MPRRIVKQLGQWVEARRDRWYFTVFGQRVMDPQLWSMNRHAITTAFGAGVAIAFIPLPVHTVVAGLAALFSPFNLPVAMANTWDVNPVACVPSDYGAYRLETVL